MAVSRQMRVYGEQDRPPEWYSQKQCVLQYESLMNTIGSSKRKKRMEKGDELMESPGENIVRRLLQERLDELRILLEQDQKEYLRVKKEMEDVKSGKADDRLEQMLQEMREELDMEDARASIEERSRMELGREASEAESKLPTSPLLTSLLQSPSSYRSNMHNLPPPISRTNDSPTLSRLLESPAKQMAPSELFTSPVKKEPEEGLIENIPIEEIAELPSLTSDDICEVIQEVETSSPLVIEIKKESPEEKDIPMVPIIEDVQPEAVIEEVAEVQVHEEIAIEPEVTEHIEPVVEAEEEEKIVESPPVPKIEPEDMEIDKEEQDQESEHPSLVTLQDSDTMEDQPIPILDQQMVNMIVAGCGMISVNHDLSNEHMEEITSLDIQHNEDSETADSVKDDSMDEAEEESAKENEETTLPLAQDSICTEASKDNDVVPSTPANVTEEEAKVPDEKDLPTIENQENEKEKEPNIDEVVIEKENVELEVEGNVEGSGITEIAVVVKSEKDTTVNEADISMPQLSPQTPHTKEKIIKVEDSSPVTKDVEMKSAPDISRKEADVETQDIPKTPTPEIRVKEENIKEESDKEKDIKEKAVIQPKVEKETVPKKGNKRRNLSGGDSKSNSPACSLVDDSKEYRAWKKSIMLVYNRMATHKYASMFLRPITNEQAPAYDTVIHRPIDLSTIKKRLETGELRTTVEFQRDLLLMFQNAMMYNDHRSIVFEMATIMQKECLPHIELMVDAMGQGVVWRKDSDRMNTRYRGVETPKRLKRPLNRSSVKKETPG